MRILVAEDETIIRMDLRQVLERAGFEVCAEAHDGQEAVELAGRERPDLAILDVKMPRLDGIEAAKQILDERPIPIVMLTAYGQDELVARAVGVNLPLARAAGEAGGTSPAVLNAANEVAVDSFLKGELPFSRIAPTVARIDWSRRSELAATT